MTIGFLAVVLITQLKGDTQSSASGGAIASTGPKKEKNEFYQPTVARRLNKNKEVEVDLEVVVAQQ
jgi:hypothetical protein